VPADHRHPRSGLRSTAIALHGPRDHARRRLRRRRRGAIRRAFTLLELITAGVVIGIVSLMALPAIARLRDRAAVHGATSLLVSALADARHQALRWQRRTAVRFDTAHARTVVHAGSDTIVRLPLDSLFEVALATTRDSIAFYPTGLGYGAANARLIIARGASAETVTVSRAGRVKR